MSILAILIIAVLIALGVTSLAFVLRRLTEKRPTGVPRDGARTEIISENAWRDKFLFPTLVSIASGVVIAVVLYLLGIK